MSADQPFQQEFLGTFPSTYSQIAVCRNCKLGPKEHLEDGKCVFEATYFDPILSREWRDDGTPGMDPG